MDVVIQHWIVAVARAADLEGAEDLSISSDTDPAIAWTEVARAGGVSPGQLAQAVAKHFRLEVADLAGAHPHAHRLLPSRVARKRRVLPLHYSDRHLWVATADPVSMEAERAIGRVSGRSVHFEVAPPSELDPAVARTYPESEPTHVLPPLDVEGRGGPRILVVDDAPDTRLLLRTALEKDGFRVVEAASGEAALATVAKATHDDPFSLVTLDLGLPGRSGREVLTELREGAETALLPVIVATGFDDPQVEMELFEAGADDFVVKPVDPPRLLLRVHAVLRRYGMTTGS